MICADDAGEGENFPFQEKRDTYYRILKTPEVHRIHGFQKYRLFTFTFRKMSIKKHSGVLLRSVFAF